MSGDRKDWEWLERNGGEKHREKVQRKHEKIGVLKALLEMHEALPDHDHAYVVELRAKLRTAVCNLEAMRP